MYQWVHGTDSGQLNHKVVTHPVSSLAQDRESSPAETSVLTTMLHRQLPHTVHVISPRHTIIISSVQYYFIISIAPITTRPRVHYTVHW